VGLRSVSNEG